MKKRILLIVLSLIMFLSTTNMVAATDVGIDIEIIGQIGMERRRALTILKKFPSFCT